MNRYKYTDEKRSHLHTLDDKPLIGTSTACKIISKPLTWWASGMALEEFGWRSPKKHSETDVANAAAYAWERIRQVSLDDYKEMLDRCYRAHDTRKKDAASDGVDMHADLERYVKHAIEAHEGKPFITNLDYAQKTAAFSVWAVTNVQKFLWSEAHCYSERLWVGGISDCGVLMNDGKVAVLDFKSSKDAYFDQFVQAAGYAIQIEENGLHNKDGERIAVEVGPITALYIVPFGSDDPTPRAHYDVEGRKADFEAAVRLYKGSEIFANN
jgi:hypothetical protein